MTASDKEHSYTLKVEWTGNEGKGTSDYRSYKRNHEISSAGKPVIPASSDPAFRGDRTRYNPEELLVASVSSCHMLWYLHLCADSGIVVREYVDSPVGKMVETDEGGRFKEVVLYPVVKVSDGADTQIALQLHEKAHHLCYVANSVNFPVLCQPSIEVW